MASEPYCYKPLSKPGDQIRLLTVLPNRDTNSIIRASFSIHGVPPPDGSYREKLLAHLGLPPYYAISYRWAVSAKLRPNPFILINGKRFHVDEGVHDALRVFRSYASTPLRYWIDCSCINQTEEAEKSRQIPLMPDIYGLASQTIVCLNGRLGTGHEFPSQAHIASIPHQIPRRIP